MVKAEVGTTRIGQAGILEWRALDGCPLGAPPHNKDDADDNDDNDERPSATKQYRYKHISTAAADCHDRSRGLA